MLSNMENKKSIDNDLKFKIESRVLNRLISHLQKRSDVQNIDLMNLSGFCRNCLSKWYAEESNEFGLNIDKDESREIIYGMPHKVWKDKYQKEASSSQINNFKKRK